MKRLLICIGICLFALNSSYAQKFTALVNKKVIRMGETFQLSFRMENIEDARINYPDLSNYQVMSGPNQSRSVQIVNGSVNQSLEYSFYLRPTKKGKFTIGPASIKVGGKNMETRPLYIQVVDGAQAPQAQAQRTKPGTENSANADASLEEQLKEAVFVKAYTTKKTVYQGEQLTVTYKLYVRQGIRVTNVVPSEAPSYNGFWVEEVDPGTPQLKPDEWQGQPFNSAIIKKVILFPQKSGALTVDALSLESRIQVRVQNKRSNSIFDSFFDRYQTVAYDFASNSIDLNVRPLPRTNRPADFSGAVGIFDLDVKVDKEATETNEPITLSIKVAGKGNIKSVEAPMLDFPPDFDLYDPQISDRSSRAGGVVQGHKTFDYLIMPRNPGDYRLPIVQFSYFDINKGDYVQLQSPEYVLKVTGDPVGGMSNGLIPNQENLTLMNEDIRFIQPKSASFSQGRGFAGSPGFWGLFSTPVFLFFALMFWQRKRADALADVAGTKRKKANKMAVKRLQSAKKFMEEQQTSSFYDEVVRAMWGYLSDKLSIGQSELSRDNIKEILLSRNVPDQTIKQLTDLIDQCEMALFAPGAAGSGMEGIYQTALDTISHIENEIQA